MEQVSDEIMYSFRTVDLSDELKAKLRQILFLADMVKFAKEQPLPNENDASWNNACQFVIETKKEDIIPDTPKPESNSSQPEQ